MSATRLHATPRHTDGTDASGAMRTPTTRREQRGGSQQVGSLERSFERLQQTVGNRAVQESLAPSPIPRGGKPLTPALRKDVERRFGHDFGAVQIHTDGPAARSAETLHAEAYTVGTHIVFGEGRFTPGTIEGRQLLAHELAHVVQQQSAARAAHMSGSAVDRLEASARRAGSQVGAGGTARVARSAAVPTIQRAPQRRFGRGDQLVVITGETVTVNGEPIPATARADGSIFHRGREIVLDGDGIFRYRDKSKRVVPKCNPHYYDQKGSPRPGRTLPTVAEGRRPPSSQYYDTRTGRVESWKPPTVEQRRLQRGGQTPGPAPPEIDPAIARRMSQVHRLRTEFEERVKVTVEKEKISEEAARAKVRQRMAAREQELPGRGEFEAGQTRATGERRGHGGVKVRSTTAAKQFEAAGAVTKVPTERLQHHIGAVNERLGIKFTIDPQSLQHAEVRHVVLNPNQTTFYPDRPMCGSCQRVFVLEARYRGRDLVVLDPDGTSRVFTPDGKVVEFRSGTVYERRAVLTKGPDGVTRVKIGSDAEVVHSARPRRDPPSSASKAPAERKKPSPRETRPKKQNSGKASARQVTAGAGKRTEKRPAGAAEEGKAAGKREAPHKRDVRKGQQRTKSGGKGESSAGPARPTFREHLKGAGVSAVTGAIEVARKMTWEERQQSFARRDQNEVEAKLSRQISDLQRTAVATYPPGTTLYVNVQEHESWITTTESDAPGKTLTLRNYAGRFIDSTHLSRHRVDRRSWTTVTAGPNTKMTTTFTTYSVEIRIPSAAETESEALIDQEIAKVDELLQELERRVEAGQQGSSDLQERDALLRKRERLLKLKDDI